MEECFTCGSEPWNFNVLNGKKKFTWVKKWIYFFLCLLWSNLNENNALPSSKWFHKSIHRSSFRNNVEHSHFSGKEIVTYRLKLHSEDVDLLILNLFLLISVVLPWASLNTSSLHCLLNWIFIMSYPWKKHATLLSIACFLVKNKA